MPATASRAITAKKPALDPLAGATTLVGFLGAVLRFCAIDLRMVGENCRNRKTSRGWGEDHGSGAGSGVLVVLARIANKTGFEPFASASGVHHRRRSASHPCRTRVDARRTLWP